jgi:hypothetical protein
MSAYRAALAAVLVVSACGGNPFSDAIGPVDPTVPVDPGGGVTVGNGVTVGKDVVGNMRTVEFAGDNTSPIRVNINSQDSAMLEGSYARNPSLDVAGYKAYTYQETGSNRMLVALVSDRLGSAKGLVAVDGGQFATYHGGGLYARAEAFVAPTDPSGAQGKFNYSGTYVGLLNFGDPVPGGPGGDLDPIQSYRTSGRVLITADFEEMAISGGIDRRRVVDTGDALATQMLYDGTIDATGNFSGKTQRLDINPTTGDGTLTDSGNYAGIFAGANASEIAALFVFKPIQGDDRAEERGLFTSASCTVEGGPACRP